jgi:hypothetical protein
MSVSVWAQILTSCCQSAESRASREHSRPRTMPARPRETSATRCWNPARSAAEAPEWPWSISMTWILSSGQPSATARCFQVVLPAGRLGVVDHLVEGGLADVEVGVAAQPRGGHFGGVVAAHGGLPGEGRGWLTAGMVERHLREHRDDLRGQRQRRAGRRAGITSVRAGTGRDGVGGGQGRAGLRHRCCLVVASAGIGGGGGPLGQPGCHSTGGQHRQLIPPAAARAGQRDRAQGLIAPDRRVCARRRPWLRRRAAAVSRGGRFWAPPVRGSRPRDR